MGSTVLIITESCNPRVNCSVLYLLGSPTLSQTFICAQTTSSSGIRTPSGLVTRSNTSIPPPREWSSVQLGRWDSQPLPPVPFCRWINHAQGGVCLWEKCAVRLIKMPHKCRHTTQHCTRGLFYFWFVLIVPPRMHVWWEFPAENKALAPWYSCESRSCENRC